MKSPFLFLLVLLNLLLSKECASQEIITRPISSSNTDHHGIQDFRPSHRLISFEEDDNDKHNKETGASTASSNSFNVSVTYPSPGREVEQLKVEDTESDATFSHQQIAEGRTFFGTTGGWAGVGNEYCHNHHGYNSACCSLGYSNCCTNSNTIHKKPNFHGSGVGWFASGGGVGFQHNNHHNIHNHHRYPHPVNHHHHHRPPPPPPPPPIRPVLPVVPIRPHHPPIYHTRPIIPNPPHHHHGKPNSYLKQLHLCKVLCKELKRLFIKLQVAGQEEESISQAPANQVQLLS